MKTTGKTYLQLFLTMLRIGAFTFGGGYAMLALLEDEFVSKKKWVNREEFLDMVTISESTPGPIAINSATYIGYKIGGVVGALTATLGIVIASFTLLFFISLFFDKFLSLKYVGFAFKGIQVCVIYLIFSAGLRLMKTLEKSAFNIMITVLVILSMVGCSVFAVSSSSIYYILICGVIGIAAYLIGTARNNGGNSHDIS